MTDEIGVFYVAYGSEARKQALMSINTLKRSNPDMPIAIASDDLLVFKQDTEYLIQFDSDKYGRLAKLNVDKLTPFKYTLYLDADTRVHLPIDFLFKPLRDGFDFVATLSMQQGHNWLWHIPDETRDLLRDEIGITPLQIQGGVYCFRKTPQVKSFFAKWRKAYTEYGIEHDQAALTKALHETKMKVFLAGNEFNGGAAIHHLHGQARRKD